MPSTSRLAVHVEHIIDAGDSVRADATVRRRCSGLRRLGCRDIHSRRDDFWILAPAKNRERAQTSDVTKTPENGAEARTIDEEMCQAHVADSTSLARPGVMDRAAGA